MLPPLHHTMNLASLPPLPLPHSSTRCALCSQLLYVAFDILYSQGESHIRKPLEVSLLHVTAFVLRTTVERIHPFTAPQFEHLLRLRLIGRPVKHKPPLVGLILVSACFYLFMPACIGTLFLLSLAACVRGGMAGGGMGSMCTDACMTSTPILPRTSHSTSITSACI
jgi:hypothetical protein